MLRYFLEQMGIEGDRLRLVWASAAEGQYLAESIDRFVADVRKLGPLNWSANWRKTAGGRKPWRRFSKNTKKPWRLVRLQSLERGARNLSAEIIDSRLKNQRNFPWEMLSMSQVTAQAASGKRKLALYWAASCGGCEIAVLAINEKILDVAALFDIVFWPVAVDTKVRDVERMPDKSIDVCLFNGGIRTSEQEYMAQLLRRKSKVLVAFGSCASEGCIPGLANATSRGKIFDTVYHETPSTENPERIEPQSRTEVPEGTLHLPVFYETLRTLRQTVPVDYSLPGCPPEAERIWEAILAIVENRLPPPSNGKGASHLLPERPSGCLAQKVAGTFGASFAASTPTVIGAETTVCDECQRTKKEKKVKKFYRTWQVVPDDETCLLEQGLLCCGIATRAGCGALCPQVNSPCIGCYGPNQGVHDFGADDGRLVVDDRCGRPGRNRSHHPRRYSRPGGKLLSLQPGRQPPPPGKAGRSNRGGEMRELGISGWCVVGSERWAVGTCRPPITDNRQQTTAMVGLALLGPPYGYRQLTTDNRQLSHETHFHRPRHPPGRPRQDRNLPR